MLFYHSSCLSNFFSLKSHKMAYSTFSSFKSLGYTLNQYKFDLHEVSDIIVNIVATIFIARINSSILYQPFSWFLFTNLPISIFQNRLLAFYVLIIWEVFECKFTYYARTYPIC